MKVELENESLIKTETIIIDAPMAETKVVTIKAEKDNKGVIIVAIALAVLAFVMAFFCIRKIVLKSTIERIEAGRNIHRTIQKVNPEAEMIENSD